MPESRARRSSFTLDGKSVGTAVTNSSGVATSTGVATTDAAGHGHGRRGGQLCRRHDNYVAAANATGNLVVTQATSITSVSGTASFGGEATLTATLLASATSTGIAGETVSFTLDGIRSARP